MISFIDKSLLKLVGIIGKPIVQFLVKRSKLTFTAASILNPTENSFNLKVTGAIRKTGPMDARISFASPLKVSWRGQQLGTLLMPAINARADKGADISSEAKFTVTDVNAFTNFNSYMMASDSFTWDVS